MPQLEAACQNQYAKHRPNAVVIEDKSSGIGLIQAMRQKTRIPILAYDPKMRDKQIRASASTPTVEAGKCYLPVGEPWVEDFILEHELFPNAAHDDQVDTTSMAIEYFNSRQTISGPRVRGF
jgi:predicted phage terminase large subunit-like protein